MTDFDRHKLERLTDRIQHVIGLVSYLERTHVATMDDLRAVTSALRTATAELHALRDAARNGEARS